MNYITIKGANATPGAPRDWNEERDGPCGALPVRAKTDNRGVILQVESAWVPTPEELIMLNNGGHVVLRMIGWQVPVALYCEDKDT